MRKKRGYNRDTPQELLRDYKLFAIACEGGKREPEYFRIFSHLSRRVSVDIIEDVVSDEEMAVINVHRSAPKWVLDRAVRYIEKEGLSDEDDLWFVLDKDRWSDQQIREIWEFCNQRPNWNIVVSNPCFEIWLYFHGKVNIDDSNLVSCSEFKHEISTFIKGGYDPLKFIGKITTALGNAKGADNDPEYFMPEVLRTKVYQLVERIMSFVGVAEFEFFLNKKLPFLISLQAKKNKK